MNTSIATRFLHTKLSFRLVKSSFLYNRTQFYQFDEINPDKMLV